MRSDFVCRAAAGRGLEVCEQLVVVLPDGVAASAARFEEGEGQLSEFAVGRSPGRHGEFSFAVTGSRLPKRLDHFEERGLGAPDGGDEGPLLLQQALPAA